MIKMNDYDTRFWDILTREHLVDLSQFHKPNAFDEVPLFSRIADFEFLADLKRDRANTILLSFALKYLNSVVSYEEHRSMYFAAITAWRPEPGDWIIPNLFFWSGNAEKLKSLKKRLILERATPPFEKSGRIIAKLPVMCSRFDAFEDRSTLPGEVRFFVSLARAPYPNFVTLEMLQAPAQVTA